MSESNYNAKQLRELEKLYNIPYNTLKSRQQAHGKQALDSMIIEKITKDKKISLVEFLDKFEF